MNIIKQEVAGNFTIGYINNLVSHDNGYNNQYHMVFITKKGRKFISKFYMVSSFFDLNMHLLDVCEVAEEIIHSHLKLLKGKLIQNISLNTDDWVEIL